jgi:DNA topoisomerase IA
MAIEYAKILGKYISDGLNENEEVFIKETLKKLIEQEIDMLEKEKEEYKREMVKFEEIYSLKSEEFIKKFNNGEMGDDLDFFEWYSYVDSYNRVEKRQRFLMENL